MAVVIVMTIPEETQAIITETGNDKVTIVLSPRGTNKTITFNAEEDYTADTLKIVKSYAVETIKDGKSQYQIDSAIDTQNVSLRDGNGNPTAISDEAPGGDGNSFTQRNTIGQKAKGYFINISDSDYHDISVIKGKSSDNRKFNYDELLTEVNQDNNSDNQIMTKVVVGQARVNSNTADSYYIPNPGIVENESNVGRAKIQNVVGQYSNFNGSLNQENFQNLGLQLTLKSTGEYIIPKFGNQQTDNNAAGEIALARIGSLAPGAARLGLRVPVTELSPTTILNNVLKPENSIDTSTSFPDLKEETINSYGSYNNWISPFDSLERLTQVPALAILVLAIAPIVVATAEIMSGFVGKNTYSQQVRAGFISFFGLQSPGGRTDGLSFIIAVSTAILSSRLINETGWYSTVLRGLIKSIYQDISRGTFAIGAAFNVGGNAGALSRTGIDIHSKGIEGDVVASAVGIIETFLNSKLIKFVNMLAEIGEPLVISQNGNQTELARPSKKGLRAAPYFGQALTANQKSLIDEITDGTEQSTWRLIADSITQILGGDPLINYKLSVLISKDRLQGNAQKGAIGVRPLAWSSNTTPSMYLLPRAILSGAYLANGQAGLNSLSNLKDLNVKESISPEEVEELEERLEASYMPFYIQDMRTKEILSFHAFIEGMSDDFTVDIDSEQGFGRAEKTHVYKGTNRQMSFSFWVVSTNPQDHDEMWYKINKLVTLAYPQYTKGRQLEEPGGSAPKKFIQPFSQLMSGGPLVRLRIGDVWKSNYSHFNVMRKFGISTGDFSVGGGRSVLRDNTDPSGSDLFGTAVLDLGSSAYYVKGRMLKAKFERTDQILLTYSWDIDNRVFGELSTPLTPVQTSLIPTEKELRKPQNLQNGTHQFKIVGTGIHDEENGTLREYILEAVEGGQKYVLRYANLDFLKPDELNLWDQLGETFQQKFSIFNGTPTDDMWKKSVAYSSLGVRLAIDYIWFNERYKRIDAGTGATGAVIGDFFGTNNPIMKSYQENNGKGIAGFFTRIGIDWKQSTWETDGTENRRAPMYCKIDISFVPIHDISPGIDSDGYMTAPVYPVGRYSNATANVIPVIPETDSPAAPPAPAPGSPSTRSG